MPDPVANRLTVFLCHASEDKTVVREMERRLRQDGFEPWLDEKQLLPGDDWDLKIRQAVRRSEAVIVCLSKSSVTKEGYIQRELHRALEVAEEKPEGTVFIIPVKLEDCEIPEQLIRWQWVAYAEEGGYGRLVASLQARAAQLHRSVPAEPDGDPSQLLRAAEGGDAEAIARMRTLGTNCEARDDSVGAIHWYRQAASFRDEFSAARLKTLVGDTPVFELTHTFSDTHKRGKIDDIALSADGRFAVFCCHSAGKAPSLWDAREWKELRRIKTRKLIVNTAFSPTGRELGLYYHYFINGKYGGSAGLFDVASDRLLFDCDTPGWYCRRLWFQAESLMLWENEPQGNVFLNEVTRPSGTLKKLFSGRNVLDISRDSTLLAIEAKDRSAIEIKQRTTRKTRMTLDVEVPSHPKGVAFSDDGKQFATQDDESVSIWDLASQHPTAIIDNPGALDRGGLAFSPDGALLAIAPGDSVLRLWDVKTGGLRQTIADQESVHAFAFRPDGKLLVTAHDGGVMRVWQAR
jgi:hypothetical protein